MSELDALRAVSARAEELVLRWTDGDAARAHRVQELADSLRALEAAEVAAGTWGVTHG